MPDLSTSRLFRSVAAISVLAGAIGVWWWLSVLMGSLVRIAEFGANPTQLEMYLYVPRRVAQRPAVLLALHWCTGSGPDFYSATDYARFAKQHGFIVIYPSVTRSSRCWDVHSRAALTHGGGSDPQGLLSMIQYVLERYGADSQRIFVTGHSSGGMMTQVLLGAYPDVFKAGAAFAGVPFGCFAGLEEWNEACALGEMTKSAQEWSELVLRAYPDFIGTRPRIQLWHGTKDDVLHFHNFGESIKQWTRVLETDTVPVAIDPQVPGRSWTRERYASADGETRIEAFRGEDEPHNLVMPFDEVIRFFGLATGVAAVH